jgi:hypothetical protein
MVTCEDLRCGCVPLTRLSPEQFDGATTVLGQEFGIDSAKHWDKRTRIETRSSLPEESNHVSD